MVCRTKSPFTAVGLFFRVGFPVKENVVKSRLKQKKHYLPDSISLCSLGLLGPTSKSFSNRPFWTISWSNNSWALLESSGEASTRERTSRSRCIVSIPVDIDAH